MNFAKSVLGLSSPVGYSSKQIQAETLFEEEEENAAQQNTTTNFPLSTLISSPVNGSPFSALTSSMRPQELVFSEDDDDMDFRYDEFGFKVEEEDGPEQNSNKLLSEKFVEDPEHRQKWVGLLEFYHNKDNCNEFTWESMEPRLATSEKLKVMLRGGVPHSMRPQVYVRLCAALDKKEKMDLSYKQIVKESSNDKLLTSRQIEKDLLRTMPTNACFSALSSTGIPRLRRVLRSLAWLFPDIGYCQGTGMIVGWLLLLQEEEDCFWSMVALIDDILPASYYSSTLVGVQADQRVLRQLVASYLPEIDHKLKSFDIELSVVTLHWFLTLYAGVVHTRVLYRIWDVLFYEGSITLFLVALAILQLREADILKCETPASLLNLLSGLPSQVQDAQLLITTAFDSFGCVTDISIDVQRRKHLAVLMAQEGCLINPSATHNLPKQHLSKRQLKNNKAFSIKDQDQTSEQRVRNIRQTETLVDLRHAILQVARHFQALDPHNTPVNLQADYKQDSHSLDLQRYVSVNPHKFKRAKALLDFERQDDDELGFKKNDVITILNQKDDHCWIGEINGLTGWFPAKFVELLDERSKEYTFAGDDSVVESVTDVVRGVLCPALKAVFEHGLKRPSLFSGVCHPWMFIQEAVSREVQKDFASVYSRLVLCKTYKLDEDGKVLTPEEILYRAVHSVNMTHDAVKAPLDVKFRSLMCCGLNEQALHLWLETLCCSTEVVNKWYQPSSFLASPAWVQIKCELRLLAQFSFKLSNDWELPTAKHNTITTNTNKNSNTKNTNVGGGNLREGISDIIIKHHLFSWDI